MVYLQTHGCRSRSIFNQDIVCLVWLYGIVYVQVPERSFRRICRDTPKIPIPARPVGAFGEWPLQLRAYLTLACRCARGSASSTPLLHLDTYVPHATIAAARPGTMRKLDDVFGYLNPQLFHDLPHARQCSLHDNLFLALGLDVCALTSIPKPRMFLVAGCSFSSEARIPDPQCP